jgi:hypothetical protein
MGCYSSAFVGMATVINILLMLLKLIAVLLVFSDLMQINAVADKVQEQGKQQLKREQLAVVTFASSSWIIAPV